MQSRKRKTDKSGTTALVGGNNSSKIDIALPDAAKVCESHTLQVGDDESDDRRALISIQDPMFIMKLARTKPCDAANQCQLAMSTLNNGFNRRKYELLAASVGIAYNLQAVGGQWRIFCKSSFWESCKRKPKDSSRGRNKALAYVMRYVFNATTKSQINVTNRYAKMLENEYIGSVKPEEIADIIQGYGGIEAMRRARVSERRIEKRKKAKSQNKKMLDNLKDIDDLSYFDDLDDVKPTSDGRSKVKPLKISKKQYRGVISALEDFTKAGRAYFKSRVAKEV